MADMVERVARALCARHRNPDTLVPGLVVTDHGYLGMSAAPTGPMEPAWLAYETDARAAIEAMRPLPRELFVHSVRSYADERGNDYEDHADWWSDVIDAALNSSPPSQSLPDAHSSRT